MAVKKSTSVATRKSTDVATIQAQLAAQMATMNDRLDLSAGSSIKTRDKLFTFPDGTTNAGPIQVVIVDFAAKNVLYKEKWRDGVPNPALCFAVGKHVKDLRPSPNCEEPQSETCATCPNNQFGSDGNGKACKNSRVLAVLSADATDDEEMMSIEVSPTAIKGFDKYVAMAVGNYNVPPVGLVTEVAFHPEKTWSQLIFGQPVPNENIGTHLARSAEAEAMVLREPAQESDLDAPAPVKKTATRRGAPRRK